MAKLYQNATTGEYYTITDIGGESGALKVDPDGTGFLLQNGIGVDDVIPADILSMLWDNGWLTPGGDELHATAADTELTVREPQPVRNENLSETNAPVTDVHVPPDEPLPSVRMEPRPWMEQENVERMQAEADPAAAGTSHAERRFSATPADVDNANPLMHPEDAAFIGGVWFWVLVVAAVAIIAWGLFEIL